MSPKDLVQVFGGDFVERPREQIANLGFERLEYIESGESFGRMQSAP
ncbi:MAG: hypothetical protein IPM54_09925 [Polyangiaceae bacterium]|nr:hypothetical protein [Polyangiaceae bacterium]